MVVARYMVGPVPLLSPADDLATARRYFVQFPELQVLPVVDVGRVRLLLRGAAV